MKKKKLLCAVLVWGTILALTACGKGGNGDAASPGENPVSITDAEQPADKDFIYDNFSTYVELTGYQGKDEIILVPSTIEGLPVVSYNFIIKEGSHVRGIVFDEGYTNIPDISCESNDNSPIESIKIPSTCTEINSDLNNPFSNLPYLSTIEVAEGNSVYSVEDGILYATYGDGYKLLMCYPAMKEGEVFLQPDETHLVSSCFANNPVLKRVENAKAWSGENAFLGSSVEEVVCSDQWTFLGQHEFEDYSGESPLRSITLSANLDDLVWKVDHFAGLNNLEEIIVPEGNPVFFSEDGVLYFVGSKETYLLKYPNAHPGEDFNVSEKADMLYLRSTVFENPIYLKRVHVYSKWESLTKDSGFPNGIEVIADLD